MSRVRPVLARPPARRLAGLLPAFPSIPARSGGTAARPRSPIRGPATTGRHTKPEMLTSRPPRRAAVRTPATFAVYVPDVPGSQHHRGASTAESDEQGHGHRA